MVVRKLNYYKLGLFILAVVLVFTFLIVGSVKIIGNIKYKKTYEYKLINVGYSKEEASILEKKLSSEKLDILLKRKYNAEIVDFVKSKYFIYKNLDKYIEYKSENKKVDIDKIVAIINTEANIDWLDNEKETDLSKNELMLVNRLYALPSDYEPLDLINVSSQYSYDGVKISNSIMSNIISLIEDAKSEGFTFVLSSGYRSYSDQEKIFNSYKDSFGYEDADKNVARAGHSEYQTGLSFDIVPYNKSFDNPKESDEYIWLRKNAYRYGFIFRFDEDKKDLTLFDSYTWRLRYVGNDASSMIYNENICFEEYYAYFVNKE